MPTADLEKVRRFMQHLPLCQALDMRADQSENGEDIVVSVPYREDLIGDPKTGVIHGGVVSILLDTTLGAVAFVHPENTTATATIDLRIDYMRPAKAGARLYATAQAYQLTRSVAFLRGRAWDDDPNSPVAMAAGAFTFAKKG